MSQKVCQQSGGAKGISDCKIIAQGQPHDHTELIVMMMTCEYVCVCAQLKQNSESGT